MSRAITKPLGIELAMEKASEVGKPEGVFCLERIAGGSSVDKEAERLGMSPGAFLAYYKADERRWDAYQQALSDQAELDHQKFRSKAMALVDGDISDPMEISAVDKGLKHMETSLAWNNRRFSAKSTQEINVNLDIQSHLARIRKVRAQSDDVLDVEYKDVTE